jgi:hypothetical protein
MMDAEQYSTWRTSKMNNKQKKNKEPARQNIIPRPLVKERYESIGPDRLEDFLEYIRDVCGEVRRLNPGLNREEFLEGCRYKGLNISNQELFLKIYFKGRIRREEEGR